MDTATSQPDVLRPSRWKRREGIYAIVLVAVAGITLVSATLTASEIADSAEKRLYAAKNSGRNQVVA